MKKSRSTEAQIVKFLKEFVVGKSIKEVCRDHMPPSTTGSPSTPAR